MSANRYFLVGDRPVQFVATAAGGMDVLAFDWATGTFVREMRYLTRCSLGGGEVDEVEPTQFEEHVARLRAERAQLRHAATPYEMAELTWFANSGRNVARALADNQDVLCNWVIIRRSPSVNC